MFFKKKNKQEKISKTQRKLNYEKIDQLIERFKKETDRAISILSVAYIDEALSQLLKNTLRPCPSSEDDVFDGFNAPLSSFNAKISLSARLGIISDVFARDLHLLRRIRNDFAHNIEESSLSDHKFTQRIDTIFIRIDEEEPYLQDFDIKSMSYRDKFTLIVSLMLEELYEKVFETNYFEEALEESFYKDSKQNNM